MVWVVLRLMSPQSNLIAALAASSAERLPKWWVSVQWVLDGIEINK